MRSWALVARSQAGGGLTAQGLIDSVPSSYGRGAMLTCGIDAKVDG